MMPGPPHDRSGMAQVSSIQSISSRAGSVRRTCSRGSNSSGCVELEKLLLRKVDRVSKLEVAVDMDDAIAETGHGKFQYCLWLICGLIYACCSISTTTLSFVLPAASCDFNLSASDKGLLNVMPVAGMMIGSYLWGFFADSKGRRFVLICSLLTDGCAGVLSSLCQEKIMFLIIRIFNGFGIIGSVSVVFAYLGEFLMDSKRDKILSSLELFWTLGIVVEPIIGYIFIPQKWEFGVKNHFVYNSWRLYVFLCGVPSLIMGLIMLRMPESPRFLLLQGKLHKARDVLVGMYHVNFGTHANEFPVKVLLPSAQAEFYFFKSLHDISTWMVIQETCSGIYKLHVFLFSFCLKNILLTSFIDFALNCCYNTMINWTPELLNNMNHFEKRHGSGHTLCEVQEIPSSERASHFIFFSPKNLQLAMQQGYYQQQHAGLEDTNTEDKFQPVKHCGVDIEVFIETFIVCLCCLPTTIAVLYCIQHISKKILLVSALSLAGVIMFVAVLVKAAEHLFYLMCMFEAFTTVVEAILFCIVVEIFPDQVRGIALCLSVTIGRFGAVVGNWLVGALITSHCHLPFYIFSCLLFLSCIAVSSLPSLKLGH